MSRRTLWRSVALVTALSAVAAVAAAQEPATLVLRSGERVSGTLVDMGGRDFTMGLSGGERRILIGDVAVIDFGGAGSLPSGEVSRIAGGQHLLVLRSGQMISGALDDVGGTHPLRITFKSGGTTDYRSSDVLRIYLAAPPAESVEQAGDVVTAQPVTGDPADGLGIPANQPWTRTGLIVRQGQMIRLTTTGRIRVSPSPDATCGPAGCENRRAAGSQIPGSLVGALIGRIGNGPAFGVGDQTSFAAPAAGELWLGVNDEGHGDNAGAFRVLVTADPVRRR